MQKYTTSMFVDKFYLMDPDTDDLVSSGNRLKNGMVVLIQDTFIRSDISRLDEDPYTYSRAMEANRWCEVTELEIYPRYVHNELGQAIADSSPLISFVGVYSDGTKIKRSYDASYAWIVRKVSIPKG